MSSAGRLAITGGEAVLPENVHGVWPDIREEDREAVLAVLDRGVLAGPHAPEVVALQDEWAAYVGARHCLALNSGTAALHCGMAAAEVRAGDEVIVPAFSFSATPLAVAHQGAIPVFVDVDPATYNLDPRKIEESVTERTRAIMPVHMHGVPADMDEIDAIARRHGLAVIEDAAQAHGAVYRGRMAGRLGLAAGFSLNATKNLSGGEGGLFVTDDDDALRYARRLSVFGEDVPVLESGAFRAYRSHAVGWNYRNQELPSAFARSQLRRLDTYNRITQDNAAILNTGIAKIPGLIVQAVPDDRTSVYHKYRVRLDLQALNYDGSPIALRDRFLRAVQAEGVPAVIWHVEALPSYAAFRRELAPSSSAHDAQPLAAWDEDRFAETTTLLQESIVIGSERHPLSMQTEELMHAWVAALAKVVGGIEQVAELAIDPIVLR